MRTYIIRRFLQGVVVLFVVSVVVFVIVHAAPGGPALLNQPDLDPDVARQMRAGLGLDDPLPVQYGRLKSRGYLDASFLVAALMAALLDPELRSDAAHPGSVAGSRDRLNPTMEES